MCLYSYNTHLIPFYLSHGAASSMVFQSTKAIIPANIRVWQDKMKSSCFICSLSKSETYPCCGVFFVELRYDVRLYIPRPRPRVWKKIGPPGLLLGSLIGVQISNPRRIQVHHWEFFSWATWRCGFWSWWSWLLMGFGAYWTPRSVAKFRILCRPPENPGSLIMPAQRDLAFVCSFVGLQGIVDQKVVGIWRFTSMLSC